MEWIQSVQQITPLYNTYVVDVWGVLYDGYRFSPDALNALADLKDQGHYVVLLSNSARSSGELEAQFKEGLSQEKRPLYDRFVTSGDYVQPLLQEGVQRWGPRCYFIGTPAHQIMLEGLALQRVETLEEAHFVVLASFPVEWDKSHIRPFKPLLEQMYQHQLPVVCANPDLYGMKGVSQRLCAGSLAMYYETLGGTVIYSGKPESPIYHYALAEAPRSVPPKVLCIGDSLRTDMCGAQNMGYDGLWILGGVHQEILDIMDSEAQSHSLKGLCHQARCTPRYAMTMLG